MRIAIEECLRRLEDRAGMLRYLADGAASSDEHPNEAVWSGIADACEDILQLAGVVRRSLSVDALCVELKQPTRKS